MAGRRGQVASEGQWLQHAPARECRWGSLGTTPEASEGSQRHRLLGKSKSRQGRYRHEDEMRAPGNDLHFRGRAGLHDIPVLHSAVREPLEAPRRVAVEADMAHLAGGIVERVTDVERRRRRLLADVRRQVDLGRVRERYASVFGPVDLNSAFRHSDLISKRRLRNSRNAALPGSTARKCHSGRHAARTKLRPTPSKGPLFRNDWRRERVRLVVGVKPRCASLEIRLGCVLSWASCATSIRRRVPE